MATIKLNKTRAAAPRTEARSPLRPTGTKRPRPTLAQAQAERAERQERRPPPAADRPPSTRDDRRRPADDPRPRRAASARDERRPLRTDDPRAEPRRRSDARPASAAASDRPRPPHADDRRPPRPAHADDRRPPRPAHDDARPPRRAAPPTAGNERPRPPRADDRRPPPQGRRDDPRPPRRTEPAPGRDDRPGPHRTADTRPPRRGEPPRANPRAAHRNAPPPAAASDAPAELPRLSKRMSELGLASRREADEWIARGLVRVDGVVVDQLGARVSPRQHITVDPQAHAEQSKLVTILLHKPLDIVSGQAEDGHVPAATLVNGDTRWAGDRHPLRFHPSQLRHLVPAGRLDVDSTGLLVLTQDGRVAKTLIGVDTKIEKEYVVHVAWTEQPELTDLKQGFPPEKLDLLREGLELDGQKLKPAKVSWANEQHLRFVLREGKRRQIRRMCEAVGLKVLALKRIRIGRVGLGEMPPGQWRYLGAFEAF